MITRTFTLTTKEISQEQIWKLMSDVNGWAAWDDTIEYARLNGKFENNTFFELKPKGGPKVKIQLLDVRPDSYFKDVTFFPLAKMYDEHEYAVTEDSLKVTHTLTMKGVLAFLWYKIVGKNIADNFEKDIKAQIAHAKKL
jgi:hypothetical protein